MSNEELVKLIRGGKCELMGELYTQNRRFIMAIVKRIGIQSDNYEDAMQDAYFGLHEAVRRFDERKGYKFLTYAKYHMIQYLCDRLCISASLTGVPPCISWRLYKAFFFYASCRVITAP